MGSVWYSTSDDINNHSKIISNILLDTKDIGIHDYYENYLINYKKSFNAKFFSHSIDTLSCNSVSSYNVGIGFNNIYPILPDEIKIYRINSYDENIHRFKIDSGD